MRTLDGARDARAISLFAVNRRPPIEDSDRQDAAFAFQVELSVEADRPLIPRENLRGLDSSDRDERLADLHYRDVAEYAVGHNVSTRADIIDGECRRVRTEWMPQAEVERVEPTTIPDVEFGMERLSAFDSTSITQHRLEPLVTQYRCWIAKQKSSAPKFTGQRREVADELVRRASRAADRIQAGIDLLTDPDVLDAFRIANRAMAAAVRRRRALDEDRRPHEVEAPAWRPFQLAYILMNLRGIAEPSHVERDIVDLLYFPTGGGKTEAYLGLAAFTLVLRRLRNPDPACRGLSVLMRYTLRLLTLDQLGRATALVCALELEREKNPGRLGDRPFEIALWVGRAATPNHMGRKGESSDRSARAKTLRYAGDSSREPPLPLNQCPWCGTRFSRQSFKLHPNPDEPTDLQVRCASRRCDFSRKRGPPIVAVDEPIYRRLPAFMIATADKFAALPWTGETAHFFRDGDPHHPRPPDLIIQDELHLISGPLGTMAGLSICSRRHATKRRRSGPRSGRESSRPGSSSRKRNLRRGIRNGAGAGWCGGTSCTGASSSKTASASPWCRFVSSVAARRATSTIWTGAPSYTRAAKRANVLCGSRNGARAATSSTPMACVTATRNDPCTKRQGLEPVLSDNAAANDRG